jgi:hypothetical protein
VECLALNCSNLLRPRPTQAPALLPFRNVQLLVDTRSDEGGFDYRRSGSIFQDFPVQQTFGEAS